MVGCGLVSATNVQSTAVTNTVGATLYATISVLPKSNVDFGNIQPGTSPTANNLLTVTSNAQWDLAVSDKTSTVSPGFMKTSGNIPLGAALILAQTSSFTSPLTLSGTDQNLYSGHAATPTGLDVPAWYKQTFSASDTPGVYGITVTWTATATF